ncbi:tetratricopeptide repeat protein [Reichenbachiella agarivorans]|uniref:Tetratricopeptide repeat protein n=1 Tax=Reichenbachiella agarivorans TaxID=2979464 RepID=A0ABY6CQ47_9BACT|nr:tetratricopeptide repeat protein [Reichenbachiella agarivorans]UXP32649.1 tetratricopeptide repeat protein [Reichenbachiella agarivorans]
MTEEAMRQRYIIMAMGAMLFLFGFQATAQDDTLDEEQYLASKQLLSNGWTMIDQEQFENAVDQFNQSITIFDGNTDAFVGRATALMRLGRLADAERDIEQALLLSPDQADMYYLAGNIYFKMDNYEKATENYSLAIKSNYSAEVPVDIVNLYYNRGNAYFSAGMYRSAINDFSRVIEEKEDFVNAYHNRALAYKNREDYESACRDFETAVSLGSTLSQKFIDRYCK